MYTSYFGLKEKPFELVPNPKFLYRSSSHRLALSHLEYGLKERAGFILMTGEVGSGKTTILRDIIQRLSPDTVPAMIFNTRLSPKQLLSMIVEEFGLPVTGRDKVFLLRTLNDYLIEQHRLGRKQILLVDEAQNLSMAVLEEIRLLSNLEADDAKLIQIVLVGQPELNERIARPELRQLRQRLGVRCNLEPLDVDETRDYILHRLEMAGNREAVRFEEGTFEVIYNFSGGVPRLINVFCDFLLLSAFVEDVRELSLGLVEEVVGSIVDVPAGGGGGGDPAPEDQDVGRSGRQDLNRRLQGQEKVVRKMLRRQQVEFGRLHQSVERIAHLLETLPERLVGGGTREGDVTGQERIVKIKC